MQKYIVVAYDKDSDYYHECYSDEDPEKAIEKAKEIAALIEKDEYRNPSNNEPFDWVWVEFSTNRDVVIWTSWEGKKN